MDELNRPGELTPGEVTRAHTQHLHGSRRRSNPECKAARRGAGTGGGLWRSSRDRVTEEDAQPKDGKEKRVSEVVSQATLALGPGASRRQLHRSVRCS